MPQIRYEQAVYGSFPFWHRGYDLLAHSPGCRPEWLAGFRTACERYGEPSGTGDDAAGALFALRLPERGPWLIVGVCPQGADDHGRPGALAFHGLFVEPCAYRRAGSDPFAFAGALRCDWGLSTTVLPAGTVAVGPAPELTGADDPEAARIAAALARGRRVALEASRPIGEIARRVWRLLPPRCRRRLSVATLAFGNANRFDLVALPRLAAVELDRSYRTADALPAPSRPWWARLGEPRASDKRANPSTAPPRPWWSRLREPRAMAYAGASLIALALASWAALRGLGSGDAGPTAAPPGGVAVADEDRGSMPQMLTGTLDRPPPDRAAFRAEPPVGTDGRLLIAEGLRDLAGRFGVTEALDPARSAAGDDDPTMLMAVLADRLRYRGPTLTADELRRLANEPGGDRALAWHDHLRHFAADRPLPADFAAGPLSWQLAVLAWSFRVEPHPRLAAVEVPFALADALAAPWPVRPSPLADRYPALDDYARFLARLPRR